MNWLRKESTPAAASPLVLVICSMQCSFFEELLHLVLHYLNIRPWWSVHLGMIASEEQVNGVWRIDIDVLLYQLPPSSKGIFWPAQLEIVYVDDQEELQLRVEETRSPAFAHGLKPNLHQ